MAGGGEIGVGDRDGVPAGGGGGGTAGGASGTELVAAPLAASD
jgi:hypothetical protein